MYISNACTKTQIWPLKVSYMCTSNKLTGIHVIITYLLMRSKFVSKTTTYVGHKCTFYDVQLGCCWFVLHVKY